ncbi:MAG TPA: hypothetical protein VFE42_05730 [Chloroflexota bacterium]|nr:hypothetical protein [Chloroflexota bacterium]
MTTFRLHHEDQPSPLDPPGDLEWEDNAIADIVDGNDLAEILSERPERLVRVLQEWISAWRLPRGAGVDEQAHAIGRLGQVAELLADIAAAWAAPRWALDARDARLLLEAQATGNQDVRGALISLMRQDLVALRDLLTALLNETSA